MTRSHPCGMVALPALLLLLLACSAQAADKQPPKAENIFFQQTAPGKVTILYDLFGEPGKKYTVWAYFSTDSGKTYSVLPTTTSGDVGKGVTPGILREIIWDMEKDYPQGLLDFDPAHYTCLITVKKKKKLWPYLAAGGAAVVAGAAILLLSGGSEAEEEPSTTGTVTINLPAQP